MTTAIVTDSTSDLPTALLAGAGVRSVPLYVNFGDQLYRDGLEITSAELIAGIRTGHKTPSTSQPSPAEFSQTYRAALEEADEVLSVHISGLLSGTVGSAQLAARDFDGRVTVYDSRSAAVGLGLQVLRASERAREGHGAAEIVAELERVRERADLRFTVETLDFLRINGRIGGAAALLGGLLNIKPILVLRGGRVESGGRVRGQKKALAELAGQVRDYVARFPGARVAFISAPGGEDARAEVRAQLTGVPFQDIGDYALGAVIATHAGPGTVGVAMEPASV